MVKSDNVICHVTRSLFHLIAKETIVVGYEERRLDRYVAETLQELFPRVWDLRVVQNLLKKKKKNYMK